jgi:hypothetical protein
LPQESAVAHLQSYGATGCDYESTSTVGYDYDSAGTFGYYYYQGACPDGYVPRAMLVRSQRYGATNDDGRDSADQSDFLSNPAATIISCLSFLGMNYVLCRAWGIWYIYGLELDPVWST